MITSYNQYKKIYEKVKSFNQNIIDKAIIHINDDYYKYQYFDEHIYEDPDDYDESKYQLWYLEHIEYILNEFKEQLERLFIDGTCTIYRVMTVNDDWFNNLKPYDKLGIYWSYDEDVAEPHWGHSDKNQVNITAVVKSSDVDYKNLYITRLFPYTGEEEKEIRLLPDVKFSVTEIKTNDEVQDLSKFKKLIFKA